jgi:hypothetical protein
MNFRLVKSEEIPYLEQRMKELGSEYIDLSTAPAWIAEDENGVVLGILSSRLIWNLEPLLIFPESTNKITSSRAAVGLLQAAESWLRSPANGTGIRNYFVKVHDERVKRWASRLGWFRQWVDASFYIKHL